MKRVLLGLGAVLAVIAIIGAAYLFQLTAPIDVANTPPVAPTLSVPTPRVTQVAAETPASVADATPTATTEIAQATQASAPAARVYRIDPNQSEARYSVGETFFDQRGFVVAVGTTNAVAGDILVDPANLPASQVGEIVVDISQLQTDEPMRDNAIRREWLESATYPLATFNNATLSNIPATAIEGQPFTFQITGDMTIREVTNAITWEAEATFQGEILNFNATTQIKMSDFGVDPPQLMSLSVEDDVELSLDVVATAVE